jgi:ABC-type Fe3+ transport system permease subunit
VVDVVDLGVAAAVAALVLALVGMAVARRSPARGRVVMLTSAVLAVAALVLFLDPSGA